MKALVTLPVMLSCKRLATHSAYEGSLVGVGAKVRAQVVRTGEALGAERALESCRVFLHAFGSSGSILAALALHEAERDHIVGHSRR